MGYTEKGISDLTFGDLYGHFFVPKDDSLEIVFLSLFSSGIIRKLLKLSQCDTHLQTFSVQCKFRNSAKLEELCKTWNRTG